MFVQERRVWMAEKQPITDGAVEDEYLFPMSSARNYVTDGSDVDSLKGVSPLVNLLHF